MKEHMQGIPINRREGETPFIHSAEHYIDTAGLNTLADPTMKPMYEATDVQKAGNGRFVVSKYHDLWASIIFLTLTLVLIIVACITIVDLVRDESHLGRGSIRVYGFSESDFFIALAVTGMAGLVAALVMLGIMYFFPKGYIVSIHILSILATIGLGVFNYLKFNDAGFPFSLVCGVLALLQAVYMCLSWRFMDLSSILLAFSVKLVFQHPAIIFTSCMGFFVHILYLFLTTLTIFKVCATFHDHAGEISAAGIFFVSLTTFCWYWGGQVISNVVHVTVAGVAATVYFLGTCMPSNPTWKSFVRATTTSFGSICFGSLLVAIIQLMRNSIRSALRRNSIMLLFIDCFMSFIEGLMKFFNHYAFTYIAIYGDSYVKSAKKAWDLIQNAPCSVFFNKTLISNTINLSAILVTVLCVVVTLLIQLPVLLVIICALWIFIICVLILRVLNYAETALFVCVAEAPDALQYSEPELHSNINNYVS